LAFQDKALKMEDYFLTTSSKFAVSFISLRLVHVSALFIQSRLFAYTSAKLISYL